MAERHDERPRPASAPIDPVGPIRRILVALDASADSVAGLEAAADLAALLDAELLGLFVEDLNLFRLTLAATEIDSLSGEPRRLVPEDLERHLRRRAERARKALERVASALRVRWRFRTVRGRVTAELLAAEADLIAVGTRGHSPRRGPGSTAAEVLTRARTPVLVLRRGARLGREVYAWHDGSEGAARALAVAVEIARRRGTPLTVLVPETGRPPRDLPEAGTEVRFQPLSEPEARHLPDALRRFGCGLLVTAREAVPGVLSLRELIRKAPCPVLVVG